MAGIFSAITDFFAMIGAIFSLIFNLLFMLFWLIFTALRMLVDIAGAFPILTAGMVAIIVICIVYKLLGREASS